MGEDRNPSRKSWWRTFIAAAAAFLTLGLGTGRPDDPDKDIGD
jgi:hypothetical protein